MRLPLLCVLFLALPAAVASPPFDRLVDHPAGGKAVRLAGEFSTQPQRILPERQSPKIGNQQAAARVKEAYGNHKILAIQLIETRGPPVYRVKTLSDDGVVKYVYVDGSSGDVFE